MEIRYALHPQHAALLDTAELRDHFLMEALFTEDKLNLVYSTLDRLIVGGACPAAGSSVALDADEKSLGAAYFLERRELGLINIGGPGEVLVDGTAYALEPRDGLYVGQGAREVLFKSPDAANPAKFYLNSAPAHRSYPTEQVSFAAAAPTRLGDQENCNKRTIRKYIHPDGIKSCQLVMGMTSLDTGCVWNTMPVHTHERRMEAYLYFDLEPEQLVFHFMGQPAETRHVIVRNEQAVLSPSWSIHAGAGTANYTFIWGMAGENQAFSDMDGVPMSELL